ncbi:hypothetical protein ISN45_Aa08g009420 [Arabidopsis thaliana x Arabidopsis arenosa]|uniref:Uncharacterized protein n=1 Tax=Arabidopsis thaliana x Arabidopsis arenosa TaxID=1240361 RepID=A0A8T1XLZ3_9BRAS|nr:hypothetical protein ISN45_Aa08g009420 [Arabidopsis thaliana x Arabidopsis arenosa]
MSLEIRRIENVSMVHAPCEHHMVVPSEEFIEFFKIVLEGETLWNSFTIDRFVETNHKLRMSPPGQLHHLPPPPSTQGMSARALTAQRKLLSKPMTKACEENKAFLATAIDKKDYSRTLLVDDGSAEAARSVVAFRSTPHDFNNEPLKNLIRQKRDMSSRSGSSSRREKSRARTDPSPRSSPPTAPMGPPPPVDMSSSSQHSGEKTVRSSSPNKGGTEPRDAPRKSKVVLVPQSKSLAGLTTIHTHLKIFISFRFQILRLFFFSTAMEKEGSVFRCFKTRSGAVLPDFDKWRPAIRERYLLQAYHSSRANSELNDMVEHYEKLLLSRGHEIDTWKGKLSALEADLHSSSNSKHELEDRVDNLTSELAKVRGELQDQYDRSSQLQDEFSGVQGRLYESEATAYSLNNQLAELDAKYKAIVKLRDSELARSASKARREVKGHGMELIQGAIHFMQNEKARSVLESDIKEYESNLLLLDQTHEEGFSEEQERSELTASLAEKRSHLAALPVPAFNPQQFEEFFTESPPLSESGLDWAGSSEPDGTVPPEVPAVPVVTSEDEGAVGSEQGTSSEQAPTKESDEASLSGNEPEGARTELGLSELPTSGLVNSVNLLGLGLKTFAPIDPGSPLFLSGDGFEPAGVLFPHAVFHFPSKEKKEACDFMDKVSIRAKGQVPGPVNAPVEIASSSSEEEDEEEDNTRQKRVRNEPEVDDKKKASTSVPNRR